jgi:Holliday junction resolvase RusA-like endonuclease
MKLVRINVKPLTVNRAYIGRRWATDELKAYKKELGYLLPKLEIPKGKLKVRLEFGLSYKGSDIDNCAKAFIDCLQVQYGFNDNRIYKLKMEKVDVKKGEEYIAFYIKSYERNLS